MLLPDKEITTGFLSFFRDKFQELFKDFSMAQIDFFQDPKFHINLFIPKISKSVQTFLIMEILKIILLEVSRFPGFSKT